ncbi:MAG: putative rane protein [Acidobacteria bacterium]|jgi:uncharacterized membrane protein|nr:putative rane protein [Acidobacteriota bacterium]
MAPLIFLLVTFGILLVGNKFFFKNKLSLSFTGRAALSVMLIVTGIAHFTSTDLMVEIMPDFMPAKRETVYFTGVCELLAVFGLLVNKTSKLTAVMLIIFFIAITPANIIGAMKQVQLGGMENGLIYLIFRVPLQILFIFWAYYFGIRINNQNK